MSGRVRAIGSDCWLRVGVQPLKEREKRGEGREGSHVDATSSLNDHFDTV